MMSSLGGAVFLDRDGIINEPIIRDGLPFHRWMLMSFISLLRLSH